MRRGTLSRGHEGFAQHFLAFQQSFAGDLGAPVTLYFPQIADRDVNGRSQIDRRFALSFGPSITEPDNFGAQDHTPRITREGWRGTPNQSLLNGWSGVAQDFGLARMAELINADPLDSQPGIAPGGPEMKGP
jgi:hypothetical protein